MLLILFDIDGTLIRINGAGRKVLQAALERVYGTAGPIDTFSFAGKTDLAIIFDLLTLADYDEDLIRDRLPILYQEMVLIGHDIFSNNDLEPCPGILPLLETLATVPGLVLGLQTGNIRETAQMKLAGAGIDPNHFQVGVYGSDSINRTAFPPIAWQKAKKAMAVNFSGSSTFVVGDTPADIICAKANKAKSLAVATGGFSLEELRSVEPDYLFEDLSETDLVLRIIMEVFTWMKMMQNVG